MIVRIISTSRADRNLYEPLEAELSCWGIDVIRDGWDADIAIALGDRYEMLLEAANAVRHGLVLAHIGGGDSTLGSYDDRYRNAITALAELHFPVLEEHASRLRLSIASDRVFCVGCLSIDAINKAKRYLPPQCGGGGMLVTVHPELDGDYTAAQMHELDVALAAWSGRIIWTAPCDDPGREWIEKLGRSWTRTYFSDAGTDYYRLMAAADIMVGNSSSGITEAASFWLPVVNIGTRQAGRVMQPNIVCAEWQEKSIRAAIRQASTKKFRAGLTGENIYGDGHTAQRIVRELLNFMGEGK